VLASPFVSSFKTPVIRVCSSSRCIATGQSFQPAWVSVIGRSPYARTTSGSGSGLAATRTTTSYLEPFDARRPPRPHQPGLRPRRLHPAHRTALEASPVPFVLRLSKDERGAHPPPTRGSGSQPDDAPPAAIAAAPHYPPACAPPYWPWLRAGNQYATAHLDDLATVIAPQMPPGAASELSRIFPWLKQAPNFVEPEEIADPEVAQFRLFDAYASYLRAIASQGPLVIALDDLHWADGTSLFTRLRSDA